MTAQSPDPSSDEILKRLDALAKDLGVPDPIPEEIEEARRILADHARVWPAPAPSPSPPSPADDWAISKAEVRQIFQEEAIDRPKREIAASLIGQLAKLPGLLAGNFAEAAGLIGRIIAAWPARPRGRPSGTGVFHNAEDCRRVLYRAIRTLARQYGRPPTEAEVAEWIAAHELPRRYRDNPKRRAEATCDDRQIREWLQGYNLGPWEALRAEALRE